MTILPTSLDLMLGDTVNLTRSVELIVVESILLTRQEGACRPVPAGVPLCPYSPSLAPVESVVLLVKDSP